MAEKILTLSFSGWSWPNTMKSLNFSLGGDSLRKKSKRYSAFGFTARGKDRPRITSRIEWDKRLVAPHKHFERYCSPHFTQASKVAVATTGCTSDKLYGPRCKNPAPADLVRACQNLIPWFRQTAADIPRPP